MALAAACTPGGAGVATRYYFADRQGNVLALANQDGTLAQQFFYTPFGVELVGNAGENPFRYTGRRFDPETDLYYYRARYYDADLGRFLQVDPVGDADQWNLYAYVGNNPLNATDPTGATMMPPDATDPDGIAREQESFEAGREIGEGIAQLPSIADRALGDGVLYAGAEGSGYLGWGKDGTYNGENGAEGEYGWAFDGATNEFVEYAAHPNPKDGTPDTVGGDLGANLNFGWARDISVLTSPGSSMSIDWGVGSISFRFDDQTGEMVGMEVGPGIGVGGGFTRSDGAELTRVNPNRRH